MEPPILGQIAGVLTSVVGFFTLLVICNSLDEHAKRKKELERLKKEEHDAAIVWAYQEGLGSFGNIARMNLRKSDKTFTADTQAPTGLQKELLALPAPKGAFE